VATAATLRLGHFSLSEAQRQVRKVREANRYRAKKRKLIRQQKSVPATSVNNSGNFYQNPLDNPSDWQENEEK
jgi:hypothetical protein